MQIPLSKATNIGDFLSQTYAKLSKSLFKNIRNRIRKYDDMNEKTKISTLRKIKQLVGHKLMGILPLSRHTFNHLRSELNAYWVQLNNMLNPFFILMRKTACKSNKKYVNIAAGPFGEKGWINIDLFKHKNISFRYDCRKNIPFDHNSVKLIRCEHFLEHLDIIEEVPYFLRSCFDCLVKGGIMRIIVPDIEKFLAAYNSKDKSKWKELGFDLSNLPEGLNNEIDIIYHVFVQGYEHRYVYDFNTLKSLLYKAGFKRIIRTKFGISLDERLTHDLENHKPYSLYVESVK